MQNKSNRKVIVRISGGLGNQLFSYAAARRLALLNDAELVIDNVTGFIRDYQYQRKSALNYFQIPVRLATAVERLEPFERFRRGLWRNFSKRKSFFDRPYLCQEQPAFDQRLLSFKVKGTLYLEGYWQSENYFKDIENVIRKDLQIKPPSDPENLSLAKKIKSSPAVALHIRIFDSINLSSLNNIRPLYYKNAIENIEKLQPGCHFYIFCESYEVARSVIALPENRVTYVTNNVDASKAYADLWLMTLCDHFIVANSTFSWWGAWLGAKNENSIVIAPGREIYESVAWWGFKGLIPERWIKCPD